MKEKTEKPLRQNHLPLSKANVRLSKTMVEPNWWLSLCIWVFDATTAIALPNS